MSSCNNSHSDDDDNSDTDTDFTVNLDKSSDNSDGSDLEKEESTEHVRHKSCEGDKEIPEPDSDDLSESDSGSDSDSSVGDNNDISLETIKQVESEKEVGDGEQGVRRRNCDENVNIYDEGNDDDGNLLFSYFNESANSAAVSKAVNVSLEEESKKEEEKAADNNKVAEGEDKVSVPKWNNKRLWPPSNKTKSRAWNFGGFFRDKTGQLILDNTICGFCGKSQKYRNTPTNLTQHLQNEHRLLYEIPSSSKTATETTTHPIKSFFTPKRKLPNYDVEHPKQKAVRDKLVEWIVKDNRPLSIVEDLKLRQVIELADERIKMPSRNTMKTHIKKLFTKKKEQFVEEFKNVEYFAGTNDAGTALDASSFIDINVEYLTEDFVLKKKILDVIEMKKSKNAQNYRKKVNEAEKRFGIENKVFVYTTDNERTMRKTFSIAERNGCMPHIQSISSKKALDKQKSLKVMRLKLRKIVQKSKKSSKFKYALQKQQKRKGVKQRCLKQEVKTRFTATWAMIRSFLNDPNEKLDEEIDNNKVNDNIEAINKAMIEAKFSKKQLKALEIQSDDLRKMISLTPLLDELEEGVTLLGGEKFATGSSVLPWVKLMEKKLKYSENDPSFLSQFKSDLNKELKERCGNFLNKTILSKASFFDKRYSKLSFLEEGQKNLIFNEIKEELKLVQMKVSNEKQKEITAEEPVRKKRRFLGLELADSDSEEDNLENNSEVDKELNRYMDEKKLKSDGNPLEWWRIKRFEYPLMARLARKYLSVQGSSTNAERVMSRMGLILTKKRMSMKGELFSEIMFLTDCV